MNRWHVALWIALVSMAPVQADNAYPLFDYYIQQMITLAVMADETGVQTFREQLSRLPRPEGGNAEQAKPAWRRGMDLLNRDQFKEALAASRHAFITDPADPEIAGQLGLSYLRLRRLKEAERLLIYTLAIAPTRSVSWLHLGQTYGQMGDDTRAAGAFANARRFAADPAGVEMQLRQRVASDPHSAVRSGAQRALALALLASTASASPAAPSASALATSPATPTPSSAGSDPVRPTPSPPPTHPQPGAPITAAPANSVQAQAPANPPATTPIPPTPPTSPTHPGRPVPQPPVAGAVTDALRKGLDSLAQAQKAAQPPTSILTDNPGQQVYRTSIARTCLIVSSRNGVTTSLGSGLLVSADGLVITNNHVVGDSDNLVVKCGPRESTARVSRRSLEPDLALLTTSLKNVDSFLLDETYQEELIGRDVFVIGNPYGLEGTFSTGVISGLRQIDGVRYIQISAPISAGNSGGPVILRDGSVIGITTMALKKGQNINFAIATIELTRSKLFDPARMKLRPHRVKGE